MDSNERVLKPRQRRLLRHDGSFSGTLMLHKLVSKRSGAAASQTVARFGIPAARNMLRRIRNRSMAVAQIRPLHLEDGNDVVAEPWSHRVRSPIESPQSEELRRTLGHPVRGEKAVDLRRAQRRLGHPPDVART